MMNYPVVFKCCECTLEHSSLDLLESHIWNRHLQTFPFHCALCNYPALSEKALTVHFFESHPKKPVEFKRKILVETQMRDYIAQSIVVPVYDEDSAETEVIYEDESGQVDLGDMETLQPADGSSFHMQDPSGMRRRPSGNNMDENDQWDDQPPNLKRIDDDLTADVVYVEIAGEHKMEDGVQVIAEEEEVEEELVMQEGTVDLVEGMIEGEEMDERDHQGRHHQQQYIYDEDGNIFEGDGEEMEYFEDGEAYFITNYGKSIGARSDHHVRMIKNRHMDLIVRKVAEERRGDLRKKPAVISQCDVCGKVMKYPSRIEAHRRMHAQERAFHCPHCEKTFTQKSSLNVHLRKHTGEKPYSCTWDCGKVFVSSSALRLHEKSHSGERNFPCVVCGRLFSKKFHMLRHEKTHSNAMLDEDQMEDEEEEVQVPIGDEKAAVDEVVEMVRRTKQHQKMRKISGL